MNPLTPDPASLYTYPYEHILAFPDVDANATSS